MSNTQPNSVESGEITFYSYWLPALAPGEYSVNVTPTLTVPDKSTPTTPVTETFHVGGPRYALTGSEAYSCYPAPGQIGEFHNTLPHIVFDRCTLPWERTIDGTDPTVEHAPWLALILLTDADFEKEKTADKRRVPPIFPTVLAEVLNPTKDAEQKATSNVIGPNFKTDPYDDPGKDLCQAIDLPARLFSAVMPRMQELPYLAHVREVKTDNKETWSLLKEGKFSVVVCNRFPETQAKESGEKDWGIVNTVCLVSLEGWGEYPTNPDTLDPRKYCRVLVLGSWRFTCQGRSEFKSLMKGLNDSSLLGRPQLNGTQPAPQGDEGAALAYVKTALQMGFTPVNHDLRNDDTTISWYRGPLVPMSYTKSASYTPISCADAALRYNSETGMFDASYAAAWQLGRLLALQDQAFAQALFRFRTDYQRWIRNINTEALLQDLAKRSDKSVDKFQESFPKRGNIRDQYVEELTRAKYLTGLLTNPAPDSEPPIPATVQNWLGQAMLLYGVPFHYLVPDAAMVPKESIRFFYLNPEWINCLLQGACSVGRTSQTDELADQLLRARFFYVSEKLAFELRSSAKQAADSRRDGTTAKEEEKRRSADRSGWEPTKAVLNWPLSGYLLHSAAVESWIGMEAKAMRKDSTSKRLDPLQILRMDRLAPDLLLCIYNGKVAEIEVKQPPEAIHFGATAKTGGGHEKTELRKIKGDKNTKGTIFAKSFDVPTRAVPPEQPGQRVVDVAALVKKIREKLKIANQLAESDLFTSAEFAVEMIESPAKVTFTDKGPEKP